MDLKHQTCTAEQGARLVELGVKPVATFYHMPGKSEKHGTYIQYGWSSGAIVPAYNVAELGEMMACGTDTMQSTGEGWRNYDAKGHCDGQVYQTEAEARAALIIRQLETGGYKLTTQWRQDPNDPCADGRCNLIYSKDHEAIKALPLPTDEDLKDPRYKAMWRIMKSWTIQAPEYYKGYLEGVGSHVKLLLDAQKEVTNG